MKKIQFRTVTTHYKNKCKCGEVVQTGVMFEREFRLRSGQRWGRWLKVDKQPFAPVTRTRS